MKKHTLIIMNRRVNPLAPLQPHQACRKTGPHPLPASRGEDALAVQQIMAAEILDIPLAAQRHGDVEFLGDDL